MKKVNKYLVKYFVVSRGESDLYFLAANLTIMPNADALAIYSELVKCCQKDAEDRGMNTKGKVIAEEEVVIDSVMLMDIEFIQE